MVSGGWLVDSGGGSWGSWVRRFVGCGSRRTATREAIAQTFLETTVTNKSLSVLNVIALSVRWLALISILWGLSFYYKPLPSEPDVRSGHVYAINTHGSISYMTRTEWLERNFSLVGGFTVGVLSR